MAGTRRIWKLGRRLGVVVIAVVVAAALLVVPPVTKPAAAIEPDPEAVFVDDFVDSLAVAAPQAARAGLVGWTSRAGCDDESFEFPPVCAVRRAPSERPPSPERTHPDWYSSYWNKSGAGPHDVASNVATDGIYFYWTLAGGDVLRIHTSAIVTGTPTVVTTKVDPATSGQIAVDGTHVYWTENTGDDGVLYRAPKDGSGSPEQMYESEADTLRNLQADGIGGVLFVTTVNAFICCVDILQRVVSDGDGGFSVDNADVQFTESYALSGENSVFLITSGGPSGPAQLREAPLANLGASTVWRIFDRAGEPSWPVLAVSGATLFWQEVRAGEGPLYRYHLGGTPEPITPILRVTSQLDVIGDYLFVLQRNKILRYPLDLDARTLDLIGNEVQLEVVQAIQNTTHDIPLVAGKRTVVRLYGRIAESSEGLEVVSSFPTAVLRGWRDGSPLPGSPLLPVERRPINDATALRTNLDTTFVFELPEDWTHGVVRLEGELNPSHAEAETNYDNNSSERIVPFSDTRGICLDMLPVLTTAGTSVSGFQPEIRTHFARMKSMYPTANVGGLFRGGTRRTIPLVNEPYNLFDEHHRNMLSLNLGAEFRFSASPSQCGDRFMIRTAYVPDAGIFGQSNPLAPTIWALRTNDGSAVNAPRGAVKGLAHEVGHQMGMGHVLCPTGSGAPAWPYEDYPYDTCHLDDSNNHIGFDVMTGNLIVPFPGDGSAGPTDYMSYGDPNWTSSHSYRKVFDRLSGDSSTAPVGGSGASTGTTDSTDSVEPAAPVTVLDGYISETGDAHLSYAYQVDGIAPAVDEAMAQTVESADFGLFTYDEENTLVSAETVNVAPMTTETDDETVQFIQVLDGTAEIARIEVVDEQTGEVVLSRAAGVNAPTLAITSPSAGDSVGDTMTVAWTQSDADGDTLASTLRYSTDGGATWTALHTNYGATEMTVDMSSMPGSPDAFVEVITSDGLHSTSARVGPFEVATHAPQVQVMTDDFEPLDDVTPVTIRQSDTLVLRGYGYDAEDGELGGEALQWSLSGRVARTGSGTTLRTSHLPPGDYNVELDATDAEGQTAAATTQVHVLPKGVAGGSPTLDGDCRDSAYAGDTDPLVLRYAAGHVAEVRTVHGGGHLFACFGGLADSGDLDQAELRIDLDADGGDITSDRDLFFRADSLGGAQSGRGTGTGADAIDGSPNGMAVRSSFHDGAWNVEFRIDEARFGTLEGLVGLRALHHQNADGDTPTATAWPGGSLSSIPDSWGLATFGAGGLTVDATHDATGDEGSPIGLEATVSGDETGEATTTWSVASSTPCTIADPGALATTITCVDNGTYTATLTASHGGETRFATTRVTVRNVAPSIVEVAGPVGPFAVETAVPATVRFTDPGTADTHTCVIDWGDGAAPTTAAAAGTDCTATHSFTAAGIYTLGVTVTDDDGGSATDTYQYAVIYDPSAGFVTGGGWITSPPGAYALAPAASGRANFGFTSRYQKGAAVPDGSTRFHFNAGNLNFKSTEYEWLVVAGARAQYKGSGTINNNGDYRFLLSLVDGDVNGGRGIDRFRIKVWHKVTGLVVYDNQSGAADDAEATTAIERGNIVIHRDP